MITIQVPFDITDEWFEQYIESAHAGIVYWAHGSRSHRLASEDDMTFFEFVDDTTSIRHGISRVGIAVAVERIIDGSAKGLNAHNRSMVLRSLHDPGDLDADVGDWVTQAAAFGEVVYG